MRDGDVEAVGGEYGHDYRFRRRSISRNSSDVMHDRSKEGGREAAGKGVNDEVVIFPRRNNRDIFCICCRVYNSCPSGLLVCI